MSLTAFVNSSRQLFDYFRHLPRLAVEYIVNGCKDCCPTCQQPCYRACTRVIVFIVCCPCICCIFFHWCFRHCCRFVRAQTETSDDGTDSKVLCTTANLPSADTRILCDDSNVDDDIGDLTLQFGRHGRNRHHDDVDDNYGDSGENDYEKGNNKNYLFFMNVIKSEPRGDYIDEIHKKWWGNYTLLESHHGFIQWLFPLPEPGVNSLAQTLKEHEIKKIRNSPEAQNRLLKSYEMMLDFYGMKLVDIKTGQVARATNWRERFSNLNWNTHNNLRISRILHSIKLLGLGYLQYHLVEFFVYEIIVERTLPNCERSCFDFWLMTLDADSYNRMLQHVDQLKTDDSYRELEFSKYFKLMLSGNESMEAHSRDEVKVQGRAVKGANTMEEKHSGVEDQLREQNSDSTTNSAEHSHDLDESSSKTKIDSTGLKPVSGTRLTDYSHVISKEFVKETSQPEAELLVVEPTFNQQTQPVELNMYRKTMSEINSKQLSHSAQLGQESEMDSTQLGEGRELEMDSTQLSRSVQLSQESKTDSTQLSKGHELEIDSTQLSCSTQVSQESEMDSTQLGKGQELEMDSTQLSCSARLGQGQQSKTDAMQLSKSQELEVDSMQLSRSMQLGQESEMDSVQLGRGQELEKDSVQLSCSVQLGQVSKMDSTQLGKGRELEMGSVQLDKGQESEMDSTQQGQESKRDSTKETNRFTGAEH